MPWNKPSQTKTDIFYIWKVYSYLQGAYNKFQEFFRMGTFIDSTHMKL